MKRMERTMVRGPLYNIDLERKNAKQAEARLNLRVQRLEDICLYRMKSLAWEQKQLQKELQRLQQEILKKRFSCDFKTGIQKRLQVSTFLPQGRQKHSIPEPKTRALGANVTQEIHKTKCQMKDPLRGKEQQQSPSGISSCFTEEEKPSAREDHSVTLPEGIDTNKGISDPCQDQEVSAKQDHGSNPVGDSPMPHTEETRSLSADPKPGRNDGKQNLQESMEYAGSFQDESTNTTYLELFAKAKNAHYLRHRVPPESERLLSIREIFGHGESSWS
ncbi:coiled-coil domain-containing protein 190 isoform X2 [Perognathus longimembris pacificus]|uniref:coiled-coil domain-containing protein 190 isoform X2 n=1 Tax=Perognathus longimembris pacificus TaxID=214514 RepID=UPI0020198716|nr:coiled-coil domain-containing protein 190 isoform X2 [Perognathus longimembris pacificus]